MGWCVRESVTRPERTASGSDWALLLTAKSTNVVQYRIIALPCSLQFLCSPSTRVEKSRDSPEKRRASAPIRTSVPDWVRSTAARRGLDLGKRCGLQFGRRNHARPRGASQSLNKCAIRVAAAIEDLVGVVHRIKPMFARVTEE